MKCQQCKGSNAPAGIIRMIKGKRYVLCDFHFNRLDYALRKKDKVKRYATGGKVAKTKISFI